MSLFWVPEFKWQLVEWLERHKPGFNWKRMKKKDLKEVYLSIRRKERR